ncbi:(6-4)DNA photolyase [Vitis vinifera]|uniref:(6-4)DNA photolyase n=1 Tax=Vitis vinifera TaxID=29760 RepID=A0A438HB30_VITVI|nr:(6-4)DNA photolyase [Vitis vinifera]
MSPQLAPSAHVRQYPFDLFNAGKHVNHLKTIKCESHSVSPHPTVFSNLVIDPILRNPSMASGSGSLMWFRKGLRIHDNPALQHAAMESNCVYPVFVIDPYFMEPDPNAFSPGSSRAGLNRIRFLLESLVDLDSSLRQLGSRLLVLKGDPGEVIIQCLKKWEVKRLCFEYDTDPYYQALDIKVKILGDKLLCLFHQNYASAAGIEVFSPVSHTLFDSAEIIQKLAGNPHGHQSPLLTTLSWLPPVGDVGTCEISNVPTVKELGYEEIGQDESTPFKGGESEALKRLRDQFVTRSLQMVSKLIPDPGVGHGVGVVYDGSHWIEEKVPDSIYVKEWVANFEKPKGDPSAFLKPATTVLSPYLKFGCLSSRYFYQCLTDVYKNMKWHTSPPVSLVGQLLWRDFFYTVGFGTPNFDRMKGNRICKQIPWNDDDELLAAWREARTGYPWIDAIMVQLRKWGWMHHLARHCVACFLTRGDLDEMFLERLLIDSDWAINNGNWLWLSCSSFFLPVVCHDSAIKECKRKLAEAYALNKRLDGSVTERRSEKVEEKIGGR